MEYCTARVIAQRKALVERLVDLDENDGRRRLMGRPLELAEKVLARLPERYYALWELQNTYAHIWAADLSTAVAKAEAGVDPSNYSEWSGETQWIICGAYDTITGDHSSSSVTIEPEEPHCSSPEGHDWCAPYSVVGHRGLVCREVCRHCGAYRITNTRAQNPETGEQGLERTSYETADAYSLSYVEEEND